MPELPEVETTCRGIKPHIHQQTVKRVIIRDHRLRWPIPQDITNMENAIITDVCRRGKYIVLSCDHGKALLHLGMSGRLHVLPKDTPIKKHDHVDIVFSNDKCLRFHDPRRFGALLWTTEDIASHKLLEKLGPEPLIKAFNADYLFNIGKKRRISIKQLIMDSHVVVGVGNIYAAEALFLAGIHPKRDCNKISLQRYTILVDAIKHVLRKAIAAGGTSFRDFQKADGKPGYFQQELNVYGRADHPCKQCGLELIQITQNNRSTVYCKQCQK